MNHPKPSWTFLTNHSHVLLCLAKNPTMRMRDIARAVGITERAVQRIIAELRDEKFIGLRRQGRCNVYRIHAARRLKHPLEARKKLADLLNMIGQDV